MTRRPVQVRPIQVKRMSDSRMRCRHCREWAVWFVDSGGPSGHSVRVYCDAHLPPKHRPAEADPMPR